MVTDGGLGRKKMARQATMPCIVQVRLSGCSDPLSPCCARAGMLAMDEGSVVRQREMRKPLPPLQILSSRSSSSTEYTGTDGLKARTVGRIRSPTALRTGIREEAIWSLGIWDFRRLSWLGRLC
jgi:hypothetical protein